MPDTPTAQEGGGGFPPPNPDGTPALVGPDEHTRSIYRRMADREHTVTVTGNYADIQRLGAAAAEAGRSTVAGVDIGSPPGVDMADKNVVSPAQADAARGEATVETVRTGLLDPAPPRESRVAEVGNPITPPRDDLGKSGTGPQTQQKK